MSAPTPNPEIQKAAEIGKAVVAHVNSGATDDGPLWDAHWHDDFVSVEGDGTPYEGRPAVQAKCDWWMGAHTVHSVKATGPFAGPGGFCVRYDLDVEPKDGSWPRMVMSEIGVYTIKDGKVVREEFMYGQGD